MIQNKLLDLSLVDSYFSQSMTSKRPLLHMRSVYFAACFFNILVVAEKKLEKDDFPKIFSVFCDIAKGKYQRNNIDGAAFEYFIKIERLYSRLSAESKSPKTDSENPNLPEYAKKDNSGTSEKDMKLFSLHKEVKTKPKEQKPKEREKTDLEVSKIEDRAEAKMLLIEWQKSIKRFGGEAEFATSENLLKRLSDRRFVCKLIKVVLDLSETDQTKNGGSFGLRNSEELAKMVAAVARHAVELSPSRIFVLKSVFVALVEAVMVHLRKEGNPRVPHWFILRLLENFKFGDNLESKVRVQVFG
ncbi:hypothetical protein MHBO_004013 [Bonamia ostreae]|uniref:Uncharacterized protein n=1 Tax=Bonamia ostreae TaxID=126728 RepID=A0ABV2AS47_9EUKA